MSEKGEFTAQASIADSLAYDSTVHDQKDMRRMGKKQELVRNFRIITSIGFTSCVMGTWEVLLTTNTPALIAGGTAGLFWSMVWAYVGQSFVVLSLAEMSSMAPTAGGQYHWVCENYARRLKFILMVFQVSEFAPPKHQKILSYTSGWLSTLGWQAFTVVSCYVCSETVQSMITLNNPDYVPERWHQTLLIISFAIGLGGFPLGCFHAVTDTV